MIIPGEVCVIPYFRRHAPDLVETRQAFCRVPSGGWLHLAFGFIIAQYIVSVHSLLRDQAQGNAMAGGLVLLGTAEPDALVNMGLQDLAHWIS